MQSRYKILLLLSLCIGFQKNDVKAMEEEPVTILTPDDLKRRPRMSSTSNTYRSNLSSPRHIREISPVRPATPIRSGSPINIVSFSGGGVRGIIEAEIAAKIEELTKRPMSDMFEVFSGTSTGALVAAGLTASKDLYTQPEPVYYSWQQSALNVMSFGLYNALNPFCPPVKLDEQTPAFGNDNLYSAKDLVKLYETNADVIFSTRSFVNKATFGLYGGKYSSNGRYNVFNEFFGNLTLADSLSPLLIPYYDLTNHKIEFFKSRHATQGGIYNYYMKDALMATSAAPTYFDPYKLSSIGDPEHKRSTCDGGMFANNSSLCALAEGYRMYPDASSYFVLSIGTGKSNREPLEGNSTLYWAANAIPDILVSAPEDIKTYLMEKCGLNWQKDVFGCDINIKIPAEYADMDNASPENIAFLRDAVKKDQYIQQQITDVCDRFLLNHQKRQYDPSIQAKSRFHNYEEWSKIMK